MNLNLTPQDISDVKASFDAWDEIGDRAKELGAERKAVLEKAAAVYECKPAMVGKLFKQMKQKIEEGESDTDNLVLMEEIIRSDEE